MKTIHTLRTKNKQGEYIKPEYDGRNPPFWNHYTHTNKKKVIQKAKELNLKDWWIDTGKVTYL